MKHVFSVHSPITFLMAHACVQYLKLDKQDVFIFTAVNYKVPIVDYQVIPCFKTNKRKSLFQKIKNFNVLNTYDKYLSEHIGDQNFIAYVDIMSYYQKMLITNKQCSGFHFIEEGNLSYINKNDLETLSWDTRHMSFRINNNKALVKNIAKSLMWAISGYTQRFLSLPYAYDNYMYIKDIKYFSFNEACYPLVSPDKKIPIKLERDGIIEQLSKGLRYIDTIIWIDGANEKFTGLELSYYYQAIDKAIKLLPKYNSSKNVIVKLRPGITDMKENYLYSALVKNNYEVEVMRDDIVLETVFINSEKCMIIGNLSSALFYASIFGHTSYSIYSLYSKKVPTIFDNLPGYWERINFLN